MNLQSQNYLAKLLAKENLTVQHGNYPTASFDVEDRILKLPLWADKGKDVYDMLVGHEVGHALFTPAEGWHESDKTIPGVPKSYVNIIEDIRIENKIQEMYPGIVRPFKKGYKRLFDDNLFGTEGRDMTKASFMDRLNVYAKGRGYFPIEFSKTEQPFVDLAMGVDTWDDVLKACKEIHDFVGNSEDYQDSEEEFEFSTDEGDERNEISEDAGDERNEMSEDAGDQGSPNEMSEDAGDQGSDEGDERNEMSEDAGDQGSPDESESVSASDTQTDDTFRGNAQELLEKSENDKDKVPLFSNGITNSNIDAMIFDYKTLLADRRRQWIRETEWFSGSHSGSIYYNRLREDYEAALKSHKTIVNMMAKDFDRKKAAYEYSRAQEAKTGSINVNKLYQYQYSEDIFKTVTKLAQAKSHGIIMFMDLSGSMESIIEDTVRQTMIIGQFCKRVNIPFEIYTFTSSRNLDPYRSNEVQSKKLSSDIANIDVKIVEVLSNRMTKKEFNEALMGLWLTGVRGHSRLWTYGISQYNFSELDSYGSTPLNQTLIAAEKIVNKFNKTYATQNTNVIVLTDGMADNIYAGGEHYRFKIVNNGKGVDVDTQDVVVRVGKRTVRAGSGREMTAALVKNLREATGATTIGFFLGANKHDVKSGLAIAFNQDWIKAERFYDKNRKKFLGDGVLHLNAKAGYDDFFVIKIATPKERSRISDTFEVKNNKNGKSTEIKDIKRQFRKFAKTGKHSRQLVNKITDAVAA